MCTAATYQTKDFYFGRNLDYEFGYGETVTFTPRHYPFQLNGLGVLDQHYAILGMALSSLLHWSHPPAGYCGRGRLVEQRGLRAE